LLETATVLHALFHSEIEEGGSAPAFLIPTNAIQFDELNSAPRIRNARVNYLLLGREGSDFSRGGNAAFVQVSMVTQSGR
jgi:hypothetical protein